MPSRRMLLNVRLNGRKVAEMVIMANVRRRMGAGLQNFFQFVYPHSMVIDDLLNQFQSHISRQKP